MRCSWCEPQLDAYLEGGLSPGTAARVAAHLRTCGDCQALLGELRVIDALLATARTPGVGPILPRRSFRRRTPRRCASRGAFRLELLFFFMWRLRGCSQPRRCDRYASVPSPGASPRSLATI